MVAAQDIGSAIKGAVRGDYFWGSGGDEILNSAGRMNSSGHYYIFFPGRTSAMSNADDSAWQELIKRRAAAAETEDDREKHPNNA